MTGPLKFKQLAKLAEECAPTLTEAQREQLYELLDDGAPHYLGDVLAAIPADTVRRFVIGRLLGEPARKPESADERRLRALWQATGIRGAIVARARQGADR